MELQNFHQLFLILLSDIYSVEAQLVKDLPKVAKKAHAKELKEGIEHHHQETIEQVERLDRIFDLLNERPKSVQWMGDIKKLFLDLDTFLQENRSSYLLDAAIIATAQRIEHFEVATYGTLKEFAKILEMHEVEALLKETLKEEAHADKLLTNAAIGGMFKDGVNKEAAKSR